MTDEREGEKKSVTNCTQSKDKVKNPTSRPGVTLATARPEPALADQVTRVETTFKDTKMASFRRLLLLLQPAILRVLILHCPFRIKLSCLLRNHLNLFWYRELLRLHMERLKPRPCPLYRREMVTHKQRLWREIVWQRMNRVNHTHHHCPNHTHLHLMHRHNHPHLQRPHSFLQDQTLTATQKVFLPLFHQV